MFTVGGEGHVAGPERPPGTDLGRLLAEQGRPDAELALALQGDGLGVDTPDEHEVAVETFHLVGAEFQRVVRVLEPLPLGGEQLDSFHS